MTFVPWDRKLTCQEVVKIYMHAYNKVGGDGKVDPFAQQGTKLII